MSLANEDTRGYAVGDILTLSATDMAHGGEAIARADDGRVVFIRGSIPGDTVRAEVTKVKKRWARAEVREVLTASEMRTEPTCAAAAHGAGCCDFSAVEPKAQLDLKLSVLRGQLENLAGRSGVLDGFSAEDIQQIQLAPTLGWRTRARLGVDSAGRVGLRKLQSTEMVTEPCSQMVPGLTASLPDYAFTPGAEVIAVMDSNGHRHVVETRRVPRGRRIESFTSVHEGTGEVLERADGHQFSFPATAFWQAHSSAPDTYARFIREWAVTPKTNSVGWDLYGGVGLFVPAIADALGENATVYSVDYSPAASAQQQHSLSGYNVEAVHGRVENVVTDLETPGVVVLDPPRAGAGTQVIQAIAGRDPEQVIHIGCDPATLSRDLSEWGGAGYRVRRMALIDAFPNTHHFEVIVDLRR